MFLSASYTYQLKIFNDQRYIRCDQMNSIYTSLSHELIKGETNNYATLIMSVAILDKSYTSLSNRIEL